MITCHLTTYRASRNGFPAISFHDYLHYGGIFLAHFLIKIDLNIISSLHIVFSLCARVGWCDVCTDFTNVIKVDDVNNSNGKASLKRQKSPETKTDIVFLLCARVGWCDVCTDFINVIKVDVDVNEMSLLNI